MPAKKQKEAPPVKKEAEVAASRLSNKGRAPKKALLPDLPLDALWEIFGYLDPLDLLHLARTSKAFRAFLLGRATAPLWKASLARYGPLCTPPMPQCPSFLAEPRWVNLTLTNLCDGCGATVEIMNYPMWHISSRLCPVCMPIHVTRQYNFLPIHLQTAMWYAWGETSCHTWLNSVAEGFTKRHNACKTPSEKAVVENEWQARRNEITASAVLCVKWEKTIRAAEDKRKATLKIARYNAIYRRLEKLGWGEELVLQQCYIDYPCLYGPFITLKEVDQLTALTTAGWKTIRRPLIKYMETCKAERLEKLRQEVYESRFGVLETIITDDSATTLAKRTGPRIHPIDICTLPEIRQLMDVSIDEFNMDEFQVKLMTIISGACTRWRSESKAKFSQWTAARLGCAADVDPLTLAAAIYKCLSCEVAIIYPDVLAHECLNPKLEAMPPPPTKANPQPTFYMQMAQKMYAERGPLTFTVLDWKTWSKRITDIINACGYNPKTATRAQMNETAARVTCKLCNKNGKQSIMTWRTAFEHSIVQHPDRYKNAWERVSDDETAAAKPLEDVAWALVAIEDEGKPHWTCSHCTSDPEEAPHPTLHLLKTKHIQNDHDIQVEIEEGLHYHRTLGSPPLILPAVLLLNGKLKRSKIDTDTRKKIQEGVAAFYDYE